MLLTRECDYGVRIIRALADGTKKTVEVIASEEHIPVKYTYKIIKKLVKSDFVHSTRGRIGGYKLNKPLDSFSLFDIIKAVDAKRYVNECLRQDFTCHFKDNADNVCSVHLELVHVQSQIESVLDARTMDEVLQKKN